APWHDAARSASLPGGASRAGPAARLREVGNETIAHGGGDRAGPGRGVVGGGDRAGPGRGVVGGPGGGPRLRRHHHHGGGGGVGVGGGQRPAAISPRAKSADLIIAVMFTLAKVGNDPAGRADPAGVGRRRGTRGPPCRRPWPRRLLESRDVPGESPTVWYIM